MVLMIDAMAKRYSMLPSQIMEQASTFDLVIMDSALTYEQYLMNKDKPGHAQNIPQEDLAEMMRSTK